MAPFSGADHVVQVDAHMADVTAFISGSNIALDRDRSEVRGSDDIQWCMEKYVFLAPLRLQEGGSISLLWSGRRSLADFVGGRHSVLQHAQCTSGGDGDLPSERQWPIWSSEALTDLVRSSRCHLLPASTDATTQISSFYSMLICARLS